MASSSRAAREGAHEPRARFKLSSSASIARQAHAHEGAEDRKRQTGDNPARPDLVFRATLDVQ